MTSHLSPRSRTRRRQSTNLLVCLALLCSTAAVVTSHELGDNSHSSSLLHKRALNHDDSAQTSSSDSASTKRGKRATSPSSPTSIPITDTLPSTKDLISSSRSLLATWKRALSELSETTNDQMDRLAEKESAIAKIKGIPGTGIETDEEAKELQQHLDCMSSKGQWVRDPKRNNGEPGLTVHKQEGIYATCDKTFYKNNKIDKESEEWQVRESLKWRWKPSERCEETAPNFKSPESPSLSRRRFCRFLSHKSTLLVGDTPQYSLHDLLLDWTTIAPMSCYGDLYCREHSLCGDILRAKPEVKVEDWQLDERVWLRYPTSPVSSAVAQRDPEVDSDWPLEPSVPSPDGKTRSVSMGTLLRYRRSDSLRSGKKEVVPDYKHPSTGVRDMNQQWIADSRRSDIIIVSKAPLPFPLLGHNSTFDTWFAEGENAEDAERYAERFIEAAWKITEEAWLPELLETLRLMRVPASPPDQLIVYRSGWRSHPDCGKSNLEEEDSAHDLEWDSPGDGPPPHLQQPSLSKLIFRDKARTRLVDRHTLWFNLQTILQNHIIRTQVAPKLGIPYLDLESSMSIWRSGMVGGSASKPFSSATTLRLVDQSRPGSGSGAGIGLRSVASGDCTRYCIASPGSGIEEAFIGGLMRVFERGWGSTKARRDFWTGDGFTNVKERAQKKKLAAAASSETDENDDD